MSEKIKFYGASWCGDCVRAKYILNKFNVDYDYIDIENNQAGEKKVLEINNGMRSIPVIIFPDNTSLTEPSNDQIIKKLGLE